ncbi:MAG: hypothetical protein K5869_11715 [Saccharofermentans sp.]|nr:hypothetical protein [Saccharofermentans sp.]
MPDDQKWYNAPQNNGRKKGKPANSGRQPSGRPVRGNAGNVPARGGKRPERPAQGVQRPVNGTAPVNGRQRPVNGSAPSGKKGQGYPKKRVNPAMSQQMTGGKPQSEQQKPSVKPQGIQQKLSGRPHDIRKDMKNAPHKKPSKQNNAKKSNLPYPEDYVAKKHPQAKDGVPPKGKRKLTPEEKKKKFEKLAEIEQAKIEGKTASRKNPSQKSAQNKAIRNGFLGTIVVVAALVVLSFVVHHLYDYIAEKPRFAFVTMGTVEHSIGAKALVVRDEEVINSANAGDLVTQITEGSRVAKDQALAMVVPESMKSVVTDLRNVQSQISDVQQELILSGDVPEADTLYRKYNTNISSLMDSVRFDAMNGNLTNSATYGASVNVVLEERESEMSKISFSDDRLTVLRNDEKLYQSQIQRDAAMISAHKPGIVSFRLDGNESAINYSSFLNMPLADVRKLINDSKGAITSDLYVKEGQGAVRIAQNENQYITVNLSKNDAAMSDFAVGTKHDINVRSEGISIDDCEVVRCEEDAQGMLITFNTARAVESLLDRRTVDIEIVISESSGMKTSVASLMNQEYAPKGSSAFCVYFGPKTGASVSSFTNGDMFNVNVVPNPGKPDENGQTPTRKTINVPGCTVIHTETLSSGGFIVAFTTQNDFGSLLRLSRLCPDGYTAGFVNSSSGLGASTDNVKITRYTGMASVYTNNQGFVEEVRVIMMDNDREFAIIDRAGSSKVPDLNTVIITNPKTVKPGDKVD